MKALVECTFTVAQQRGSTKKHPRSVRFYLCEHLKSVVANIKTDKKKDKKIHNAFFCFQVISPALKTVNLFGYSLSCNMDIDNNQYPDLAVGSLSDSVFVFR